MAAYLETGGYISMKKEFMGEIIYQEMMYEGCYRMVIKAENDLLNSAKPGQFVHLKINQIGGPLLRRPFSIHRIDFKAKTISLLYAVVGKGTMMMAMDLPGKKVGILGPLGSGFPLPDTKPYHAVLIGGGLGAAPLLFTAEKLVEKDIRTTVILGYADKHRAMLEADFKGLGIRTCLSTEDGSVGHKGYPTDLLEQMISSEEIDGVFTCGPEIMMYKVAEICGKVGVDAWVSLEEKMACGVGACLGCVVRIRDEAGSHYEKACKEGPVFKASEVIFCES